MQRDRQDWVWLFGLWAVLIAIGEFLVFGLDLLPGQYAREAEVVDEAYIYLMAVSVPVFALVAAALLTSFLRFRTKVVGPDGPTEDGPPLHTHPKFLRGWLAVTGLLALSVTINPGFVGLSDLRGESSADLVVEVTAQRWSWSFTYENGATTTKELVLPVDQRVRFDVTALDIVHSFWVPAFRTKIDAVPGRVHELYVTPDREGEFEDDPANIRVQCAEICGVGHGRMEVPVRIVTEDEFEAWVTDLAEGA
ncbi:MAG: cytochrome c oxidase subunit II [Actinomycetia bacterium]|nr:cytochrome c oxidase subunit II [Actinomycetes bacterium]